MSKMSGRLLSVAAAALLAACGTLSVDPPAEAIRTPVVSLAPKFAQAGDLPQGPVSRERWWRALGDATLSGLIERGLAANLDLKQAAERVQRSRAIAAGSRATLLPSGGVSAGVQSRRLARSEAPGPSSGPERTETAGLAADLSWELDLFGRLRNLATAAEHRLRLAEADTEALALTVGAEIAHAWYERTGALEQLTLARTLIENRLATLDLVRRRAAAGYAAPIDEARARADVAATEAEVPVHEAAVAAATHRLAVLLGENPSTFAPPTPEQQPASKVDLIIAEPASWLAGRPDLRAAEAALAAQAHDVAAIRADFMPKVSISGVLGYVVGSVVGLGTVGGTSWFLAPSLSVPVFDRPRIQARLNAASAQQREYLLAYRQRVLQAIDEVETALVRVRQGQLQLAALHQRARHATVAHGLARKRYEAGTSDLLELLDAQRSAQQAEIALASAMTVQRQQVVTLLRALGPGSTSLTAGDARAEAS